SPFLRGSRSLRRLRPRRPGDLLPPRGLSRRRALARAAPRRSARLPVALRHGPRIPDRVRRAWALHRARVVELPRAGPRRGGEERFLPGGYDPRPEALGDRAAPGPVAAAATRSRRAPARRVRR